MLLPLIALLIGGALKLDDWAHPPLWLMLGAIAIVVPTVVIGAIRMMKTVLLLARLRAAGVVA